MLLTMRLNEGLRVLFRGKDGAPPRPVPVPSGKGLTKRLLGGLLLAFFTAVFPGGAAEEEVFPLRRAAVGDWARYSLTFEERYDYTEEGKEAAEYRQDGQLRVTVAGRPGDQALLVYELTRNVHTGGVQTNRFRRYVPVNDLFATLPKQDALHQFFVLQPIGQPSMMPTPLGEFACLGADLGISVVLNNITGETRSQSWFSRLAPVDGLVRKDVEITTTMPAYVLKQRITLLLAEAGKEGAVPDADALPEGQLEY